MNFPKYTNGLNEKEYCFFSKLFIVYVFAVLIDGSLRKWGPHSMYVPLMFVKTIVGIYIVAWAIKKNIIFSDWEKLFTILGTICFMTTLIWGHGNLLVDIYGCIPYFFGITISYIIGNTIQEKDLKKFIQIIITLGIIQSILVIIQYQLPASHILNYKGFTVRERFADMTAGELAGGIRPPGLFMQTSQSTLFTLLSTSLLIYSTFFNSNVCKKWQLYISWLLLPPSLVCSCSRSTIASSALCFLVFLLIYKNKKKIIIGTLIALPTLIYFTAYSDIHAINNIKKRFENAAEVQDGAQSISEGFAMDLYYRVIGYTVKALISTKTADGSDVPFWGYGQGMSTQIGGRLLGTNGKMGFSGFTLAEWDSLRIMCESGPLLGWLILIVRLGYPLRYIKNMRRFNKNGEHLTLTLYFPFFYSFFPLNTWGNIFQANFAFLIAGIFIASTKLQIRKNIQIVNYENNHCK